MKWMWHSKPFSLLIYASSTDRGQIVELLPLFCTAVPVLSRPWCRVTSGTISWSTLRKVINTLWVRGPSLQITWKRLSLYLINMNDTTGYRYKGKWIVMSYRNMFNNYISLKKVYKFFRRALVTFFKRNTFTLLKSMVGLILALGGWSRQISRFEASPVYLQNTNQPNKNTYILWEIIKAHGL